MMLKYDLHIHSCLSPCGDNDMTPYNLVNMAKLLGYDLIALTDHNSCLNCESAMKVGEEIGITVVAGMELCTVEEIHNVCLFKTLSDAMRFSEFVHSTMPPIKNDVDIYGEQRIMDTQDNILGYEDILLTTASSISIDDLSQIIKQYGGACFPAHLDRASYSILSVLGFLYPELNFKAAEFTKKAYVPGYEEKHPLLKDMKILKNSDAHYLENLPEPENEIDLRECSAEALVDYINEDKK
ncbi:MAG: PHP domain-containing protein [Oscillospiraceae bacterium]